ncbi:UxaA family hydrolase, partial [Methylobacterium sp.]|uniref:UxaA family hydrolase n=1 Tax=Methylobacterium sp. TaxID=409 RepID=UPI0025E3F202
MTENTGDTPRTLRLHADDNVAIVVNAFGLPAGTVFADGLTLLEFVPQGHKVALVDIPQGGTVVRYGEVVGIALRPLPRGSWVEESSVETPVAPDLDALEKATRVPAPLPPLEGYTFEGYRNPDGSVGTKNILAISISVQCVAGTLDVAIRRIKQELLPRYPNVDDVVGLTHAYGCGVAINAPEAVIPIRTLQSLARNPNFGGEVMVVGLGCEKLVSERLLPPGSEAADSGVVRLQDERHAGFGMMLDSIMAMAEARLEVLDRRTRETCPAADLVVGLQCGGSDAFSGV